MQCTLEFLNASTPETRTRAWLLKPNYVTSHIAFYLAIQAAIS
jgi:hypothetical protein